MPPENEPVVPVAAAATPVDPAIDFQRQIDDLKEQVAEGQRTAQYWADKAKTGAPAAAAAPAEEEDDVDVLEAITTRGAKGFDALAQKRGFIKTSEVETLIDKKVDARASALTKEQELIAEFPDLRNKKSDFFKDTAVAYGNLIKQGTPAVVAMELAAQQTELAHMRSGKIKPPGAAPTQTPAEKEAARLKRVAAQAGAGGGARPSAAAEEDDEGLTDEQKRVADAMGVSHEAYAKRAKAGVAMKGLR